MSTFSLTYTQRWGGSFSCETGSLYVKTEFSKAIHHSVSCVLAQWLERAQFSKFRFFSWLIAQANVLARQHTWQQALQLFPVINCPKSICRVLVKVTKLTPPHPQPLHTLQLHLSLFKDRVFSPFPTTPPKTPLQRFLLANPVIHPRKPLANNTASLPTAQGSSSPVTYHPPHHPLSTVTARERSAHYVKNIELGLKTHFSFLKKKIRKATAQ